jgi:hypothetical protein
LRHKERGFLEVHLRFSAEEPSATTSLAVSSFLLSILSVRPSARAQESYMFACAHFYIAFVGSEEGFRIRELMFPPPSRPPYRLPSAAILGFHSVRDYCPGLFFNPLSACSEGMADGVEHISASVLTEKSVADAESAVTNVIQLLGDLGLGETLRAGK